MTADTNKDSCSVEEVSICACGGSVHCLILRKESFDGQNIFTFDFHLNKLPLRKRLLYGLRYIFGYQSNYGAFDEFVLNDISSQKIINFLKKK